MKFLGTGFPHHSPELSPYKIRKQSWSYQNRFNHLFLQHYPWFDCLKKVNTTDNISTDNESHLYFYSLKKCEILVSNSNFNWINFVAITAFQKFKNCNLIFFSKILNVANPTSVQLKCSFIGNPIKYIMSFKILNLTFNVVFSLK